MADPIKIWDAALTTAFQDTLSVNADDADEIQLLGKWTPGGATSLEISHEFSSDAGVTWRGVLTSAITAGVSTDSLLVDTIASGQTSLLLSVPSFGGVYRARVRSIGAAAPLLTLYTRNS